MGTAPEHWTATCYSCTYQRSKLWVAVSCRHGLQPAEILYSPGPWSLYHYGSHEIIDFRIFRLSTIQAMFIEDADQGNISEMLSQGDEETLV